MNILTALTDALRGMVAPNAAIYALAAIGLNMHFGYAGLLNFGHIAFMLVGAYGVAISVATFHLPLWLGVVAGILAAVLLALVLGLPTLRLRADYLAITTIAAGEILRFIYRSDFAEPVTGGVYGLRQFANGFYALSPLPPGAHGIGGFRFSTNDLWVMLVTWGLVFLCCTLTYLLIHSPWGRVLRAVREDEYAARALGKNAYSYKMQSLVIGGVLGGLAGIMLAINSQSATPDSYTPVQTFYLYTLLILGGAARVLGPVLGSVVFWFILVFFDSLLRQAIGGGYIPSSVMTTSDIGGARFALVGLGLIVLMAFWPAGILGNRREIAIDGR